MKKVVVALLAVALSAPAFAGNWRYGDSKDEMRGTSQHFAGVSSLNTVKLDFPYEGGTTVDLVISSGNTLSVFLNLHNGQFDCRGGACAVSYKFDDGKVETPATSSSSNTAIFMDNPQAFLDELRKAKRLIVEVPIYKAGLPQFKFDVAGLKWPGK